ncbi:syntaxin-12-like [Drosophila sulfurigaster albostrigata]|uniref:syntaxin-12-like n=1 Tax=Drosophila sulfurigaster albostrigata TaxID=89887 RepID=UPI002D21CF22|nr:syntaxin-12-like [Drosophila sulfurigaster albostrigata]
MSQTLINPSNRTRGDYGATSSVIPEMNSASISSSNSELDSLSEEIGYNINAVHSSTKQLEKQLKLMSTAKNSLTIGKNVLSINTKTNKHIQITSQKLQRLQAVVQHGDRQQKLHLEKLTQEFQTVVDKYSMQQKFISEAMREAKQKAAEAAREAELSEETYQLEQQRQEQAELEREHDLLVERQRQVEQIEADILDVNYVMQKLSGLVYEQREMVDAIALNVEETADNAEEGRKALQETVVRQNKSRRKVVIILLIVVLIALIVIGIIVSKLK